MAGSICGASLPKTLAGPPERIIPRAPVARICSGPKRKGKISEYTLLSRTRRAITCVYCEPKSRMTTFEPRKAASLLIGRRRDYRTNRGSDKERREVRGRVSERGEMEARDAAAVPRVRVVKHCDARTPRCLTSRSRCRRDIPGYIRSQVRERSRSKIIPASLLLEAYCTGIFPMAMENGDIAWFSPDPRGIIPLDAFHIPHGLKRSLKKGGFRFG